MNIRTFFQVPHDAVVTIGHSGAALIRPNGSRLESTRCPHTDAEGILLWFIEHAAADARADFQLLYRDKLARFFYQQPTA